MRNCIKGLYTICSWTIQPELLKYALARRAFTNRDDLVGHVIDYTHDCHALFEWISRNTGTPGVVDVLAETLRVTQMVRKCLGEDIIINATVQKRLNAFRKAHMTEPATAASI